MIVNIFFFFEIYVLASLSSNPLSKYFYILYIDVSMLRCKIFRPNVNKMNGQGETITSFKLVFG